MLDVTRLRVLVAVARHGSVTAAARELNYAQPSVSHHLARLEAETGTKLIQRAGRGIRLTDAGRLLAERAAEVIGRLDAAENELAAYTGLRGWRRSPPRSVPSSRPRRPCCASTSPASTCG
jgi:molybdate transport repressor ModE-like protein